MTKTILAEICYATFHFRSGRGAHGGATTHMDVSSLDMESAHRPSSFVCYSWVAM